MVPLNLIKPSSCGFLVKSLKCRMKVDAFPGYILQATTAGQRPGNEARMNVHVHD